jgi:hypothetical protein
MKSVIKYLTIAFIIMGICCFIACGDSTKPEDSYPFPEPIDSVATNITLDIHSCFNDSILASVVLDSEGTTTIDVPDTGLVISLGLSVIAAADGFYTEVYYCHDGDSIIVDLDAVPEEANSITGVIFSREISYYYCYYSRNQIELAGPDGFHYTTMTDNRGRYGLGNLPLGDFTITATNSETFELTNTPATNYNEITLTVETLVEAPYIYLYPEQESDINVRLVFSNGMSLTQSEPPYGDGWNVHVTPDGTIDGRYDYLFYEGRTTNLPPLHSGWLVDGTNLEGDITRLLAGLGFAENEITDFNDYWIPEIQGHPYYAFFYVKPDSLVHLQITPTPVNLLRAFFVVEPLPQAVQLAPPDLPAVNRDGFTVVEWGVIGWHE